MVRASRKMLAIALTTAVGLSSAMAAEIEEIVVTASPIRDSQQAAISAKRDANHVTDVISADTIGRFPDQNLADSLGRVPGIAIERDQGQARYINFRGMPFRYTAIGFDGIDVPGAENGRIPRFDSFPAVITSRVVVNKAVLPSMPGAAVAGYVDIQTVSPFDREGAAFDADIGAGQQDLGSGGIEKLSLRGTWSDDNLGVMLFGSKNSREQITDNHEYKLAAGATGTQVNQVQFRSYKVTREDEAYGGRAEYRMEGETLSRTFVSYLYSEFVDLEERNHYQVNFATKPEGNTGSNLPVYIDQLLEYGRYDNSTQTATLGADLELSDWNVELRYNDTQTEFNTFLPILYNSGVNFATRAPSLTQASYDISDVLNPQVTLAAPLASYTYAGLYAYKIDSPLDVDAKKLKVDMNRDLVFAGLPSKLSMGLAYDQRKARGYSAIQFDIFAFDPSYTLSTTDTLNVKSFDTGQPWIGNTANALGANYYDNKGLRQAWEAQMSVAPTVSDDQLVAIDEDIAAGYVMMNNDYAWGSVVYGMRVERTNYSSQGNISGAAITVKDDFVNVLPSVHVNYDVSDDIKARFSLTSGLNRPTYTEWRAAAVIDPTAKTVSGGNPALQAEESFGLDASVEYYFARSSILSAGAFTRQISNVIYESTSTIDAGIYGDLFAGQVWELDGYVNGKDGKLSGVELNFIGQAADMLPALEGFGVNLNMTFLDGEFTEINGKTSGLPGTSDFMYNASVFYEDYGLSVRLNYQYRGEWISPIEDPSEVWGAQKRLDMNIQYQLPWDLNGALATVYLNANNLGNETDVRYAGNGYVNQAESYGARYLLGLRVNM
ncbi:MAG: TonB-dependent receptor [SAR86 cluster bacterium]|uniref:TonB-dependent receptor n=1 Tax=SAR86 cluster bacterium TaxID=2030880 RepID=A0A972VY66_9GAMM|nr:TonB-dependent receptor [SAR86 cluster bacterium]